MSTDAYALQLREKFSKFWEELYQFATARASGKTSSLRPGNDMTRDEEVFLGIHYDDSAADHHWTPSPEESKLEAVLPDYYEFVPELGEYEEETSFREAYSRAVDISGLVRGWVDVGVGQNPDEAENGPDYPDFCLL